MFQIKSHCFSIEKLQNKYTFTVNSLNNCLKEPNFAALILKWVKEWNSVVFLPYLSPHRDDLLIVTHNRLSEKRQYEESIWNFSIENLISVILFEINSISSMSPFTSNIFIRWLFNRRSTEYVNLIELIQSDGLISLLQMVCSYVKHDFFSISAVYLLFPCISEIELLIPYFPTDKWSSQISYAAELIEESPQNSIKYRHIHHLIWQNPHFTSEEIPTSIRKKMQGALKLYNWLHPNQYHMNSELGIKLPMEIYNLAQQYQIIQDKIRRRLITFRKWEKLVWGSLLIPFPFRRFVRRFSDRVLWTSNLMQHFGFRLRYCETKSPNSVLIFREYLNVILMTLIECVPSEGSPFAFLVDEDGKFNLHLLDPEVLMHWFGSYFGVLEFNLNPNQNALDENGWIYAGIIYGGLRQRPEPYIRSFSASVLLPIVFRGYGLGGMLIQICTHLLESLDHCDETVEVSTENNHAIKLLMKRFRYFKYGNIASSVYNIKSLLDKNQPITLGFQRMTWYSRKILDFLAQSEQDPDRKDAFNTALQIMNFIHPHVEKFHKQGILIKFE